MLSKKLFYIRVLISTLSFKQTDSLSYISPSALAAFQTFPLYFLSFYQNEAVSCYGGACYNTSLFFRDCALKGFCGLIL